MGVGSTSVGYVCNYQAPGTNQYGASPDQCDRWVFPRDGQWFIDNSIKVEDCTPAAPAPTPKPVESPTPKPTQSPTPKPVPSPTPRPTKSPTPRPVPSPSHGGTEEEGGQGSKVKKGKGKK